MSSSSLVILCSAIRLIPVCMEQNPCAYSLDPIDIILHGCSISFVQASAHMATISSYDLKTRLDSQFSRMNCHTFSTGLSSGDLGGSGKLARQGVVVHTLMGFEGD